jgi:hypothetical protein
MDDSVFWYFFYSSGALAFETWGAIMTANRFGISRKQFFVDMKL